MVVGGWHNVLQPLSVLEDLNQQVSPLDVLAVINEINGRRYSDASGRLPDQPPNGERPPFFDVNCNGSVDPLDVLQVVNHLNGGPKPRSWTETIGGGGSGSGFISAASCSPQLNEGNSLRTELTTTVRVPDANSAVQFTFRDPVFDTSSSGGMNDAFEIAIRDTSGNLLVLPFTPRLEAAANWSENTTSAMGPAVQMSQSQADRIATINLVGVPGGTDVQVSVRLLNNDTDTLSRVIVRGVEVVPATGPNPAGSTWAPEAMRANSSIQWPMMQELTGSVVPKYGRTTYTHDQSKLIAEVAFENLSTAPVQSLIAVIDNLSDLSIRPLQPDGYTDDGRPYWRIVSDRSDGMILANTQSVARRIPFASTADRQFTFDWRIYGEMRQGEVAFRSTPGDSIAAGNTYRYQAVASSSLGGALRYTMLSGPATASISASTGELVWSTVAADVGRHQIVIRATDALGFSAQQSFSLEVRSELVNRPPIITSEPTTDAVVASPFEVQTYATGGAPLAATLLPSRSGLKHVVTANQSDNRLGLLPSGPSLLGSNQPIDLGERPVSELSGVFEGPQAIELGIVPNTEGKFERNVQQVLAEDVNGDGNPDAIALVNLAGNGNWNDPNDRGFLVIRYGNGDGSFREGWQVQFPTVAGRIGRGATVHYADVTSDGRKDLVVTTIATNRILVYANTGTGTFDPNPITSAVAGNYVANTQIADLDRDGKLDLVLFENVQVQIGGRQAISVYRGDGTGRFTESQLITADTNNGGNGYLSDVDGLNGPDIVRLNYSNVRLETYLNDGTGGFGNRIDSESKMFYQPNSGTLFNPVSGNLDDFDGDGKVDAAIFGGNGANFMKGQGNGRFGDGTANGSKPLIPQQALIFGLGNNSGRGLDLNGDEHLDILVGNPQSYSNLIVGLGRGDGTFELSMYGTDFESDIGTGIIRDSQSMVFASAADFNRDGVVDVLVGNQQRGQQAGNVGLLLGDLPGTFRAPQSLRSFDFSGGGSPTTFNMRDSVSGDFNNDGFLDLVTYGGIGFDGGFYFAPGRGDGTFGKYEVVFGGLDQYGINSLTALDIDRDGKLDLAWLQGSLSRQAFGLGNGSFQALPSVSLPGAGGNFQNALQVDDFNRDGYPDLVHRLQTGNIDTNFITRLVVLLFDPVNRRYNTLPDVNDTMTNWSRAGGYYWDESIGIGDLNGDGKKEFFFFSRSIPSSNIPARWVILEPTSGSATDASTLFRKTVIENPSFIPHDRAINSYVVDDFDGDGINDIAYSGNHVHTTVMFGNGDFTFRDATDYYTHTFQLDSGDFNGDGVTDLVAMWGWGFLSFSLRPYQSILYGRGDGTFSEMNGFTAVANTNLLAIGDFNGDGRDELAGTPDQTQGVAFTSRPKGVSDVAAGDLNGDGVSDLVSIISGLDRVKINYQQWDQTFERVDDLFTGLLPVAVDLLDIDKDSRLDIVTANQQGKSLSMFRQTARGKFDRSDILLPVRPSDLQIGDLDGDGVQDVVVVSEKDNTLLVLRGAAGSLTLSLVLPLGFKPGDLAIGDLTGDGKLDVALSDPEGNRILVLPGRGDGTLAPAISVLGVASPESIAIADMNRDGRQDLIVAQPNEGRVGVLYQRGPGKFTTPQWIKVGKHPTDITTDDVNQDGATDVLVVNRDDNTASLILNRFDPNRVWKYQPTAIDPDGDPVAFELLDAPGGMLLDSATNTIYWAPMPEQLGLHGVVLEASDGRGGATQQGFRITVTAPVALDPPRFTSTPVTSIAADTVYRYQPNVADRDPSGLRFSLVKAPEGMSIDPTTGALEWDPRTQGLKLFTGTRNYGTIEAPDSPSLRPASVTVEGWYYFEDPKGAVYENLLAKRASASNWNLVSFGLEYFYGTLRAKVGTPASNDSLATVTAPVPVEFQKWTHVAMTFDDASNTLTLFINGENVGTAQSPESISYNNQPLRSGQNIAVLARQRVWDRALTPAEIASGMLADVPRNAAGLILQWNFNESRDARTIFDTSGARNHGTLTGTPDWLYFPSRQRALSSPTSQEIILRVEDGRGGVADQTFQLDVIAPFPKKISGIVYQDLDNDGMRDGPADANLIANPDFSSGFAGWETDFYPRVQQPTSSWLGNTQVTVGPDANAIPLSSGFGHTNGSGQDFMLVANGDSQTRVVWRQSVAWTPGQNYDFSFWAIRPSIYEAANLQVRVNGQLLGPVFSLNDVGQGTWKQYRQSLTATGAQGVLEIVSVGSTLPPNSGLNTVENAFAIDDLMLIPSSPQRVIVPGTANPYLSGMPNGSTAYGSTAPQGSPPMVAVQPGQVLRIRATGHTRSDGFISTRSPDGSLTNATGTVSNAANGISSFASPHHGSLLGVFLDDEAPSGKTPPEQLDFRTAGNVPGGIQYTSIAPQLRQLFFIGDGFTNTGVEQTLVVPAGATRLFLANSSSSSWSSNVGSFEVQVFTSSPEPVQAGRVVYLDSNRNQQYDPSEPTCTTDAQGRYSLATVGSSADVGLVGIAGQLQRTPSTAVSRVALNTVTPTLHFGSRSAPAGELPIFLSEPFGQATAPGSYAYQVFAQSPSASRLSYELASGPEGMAIDRESGLIQWNPLASQAGSHDILVKASDAQKRFSIQRYSLTAAINTPPIITSIAPQQSQLGIAWRYRMRAQDAEQSALSYRLVSAPAGMTISASTGVIDYVPSVLGPFAFEVEVTDGAGGFARQSSWVTVVPPQVNNPPQWMRGLAPTAIVQRNYAAQLVATDADAEPLTYGLVSGPSGLTVSSSGQVLWEPSETGTFSVTIAVSDTRGGHAERTDSIQVVSRVPRSTLQIESQPETASRTGQLYAYDVLAPGAVLFELIDAPVGMSIDPQHGSIRWLPTRDSLGVKRIQLRCSDLFGNSVTQEFSIAVRSSSIVPTISSAPLTEAVVGRTYLYSVRTSNPSGSPLQFELSVGPNGMQIDPQSGVVSWTPSAAQVGPTTVLLRVRDGLGNFSTQSYSISVGAGDSNRAPVIGSMAGFDGVVGDAYRYTLQATDPEGGALTYAVRSAPAGFSIDATTGVVTWTPVAADVGTVAVVLTATDPQGGAAVQSYQIDVRPANRAPEFRSNPNQRVSQGGLYRYDVLAIDPDRESLAYELIESPPGMTIDAMGRVRWQTPLDTPLGARDVAIRIRDGLGATATQRYTMLVEKDTQAPRLTIVVTGEPVLYPWTVNPAIVRVIATDNVGLASVELKVDGETLELAPDGTARVYFSAPGNGRLVATARDAAGNVGTATGRVNMRSGEEDGSGNPAPEANITSVGNGASVRGFVDVVGTALSPDFERYTLSYRRVDQTDYKLIRESTIQVSAASLGKWDTTLLENDNYVLKLEVHDTFGSFAAVEVEVGVSGNLKLGNFQISFTDITIPVAGIPITLARTYDTLRADREEDFGFGWRLEYRNTDLRTSLPKNGLEDIGIYTPFKPRTRVSLTLPGGLREGFTFTPEFKVLPGFGRNNNLVVAFPRFTSDRGVKSTLSAGSGTLLVNAFGEMYAAGGVPWNPANPEFGGYTLTTEDGIRYSIDGSTGLMTTVKDRNGNTISFSDSGVKSSNGGLELAIEREVHGRISSVTDPNGNSIRYRYSNSGDLIGVRDRVGNETSFRYLSSRPHYLESIIDPLGRVGVKTEYGADGRLKTSQGRSSRVDFAFDIDRLEEELVDGNGNTFRLAYDLDGNLVSIFDALGNESRMTYDSRGLPISKTNPLGQITRYEYDANGRLIKQTDPLGFSQLFQYDQAGNQFGFTNANGEQLRFELDGRGNVTARIDAAGSRTEYELTANGLIASVRDALGGVTRNEYNDFGFLKQMTDAGGNTTNFDYDSLGNELSRSRIRTTSSGPVIFKESRKYDANGDLIEVTDAGGKTTKLELDDAGSISAQIDPLNRRTEFQRTASGYIQTTKHPDGSITHQELDPEGRPIAYQGRAGARLGIRRDEMGQVIEFKSPDNTPNPDDNPSRAFTYDALGRLSSFRDESGQKFDFAFDVESNGPTSITDSQGTSLRRSYDAIGQLTSSTAPNGIKIQNTYDVVGNLVNARVGHGHAIQQTFDALGRLTSRTDASGRKTVFQYDPLGQLISVIDPGGSRVDYTYDELGNRTSHKDSLGRLTRFEFDNQSRVTQVVLPSGEKALYEYDAVGRLTRVVEFDGRERTYGYDLNDRIIQRQQTNIANIEIENGPNGLPVRVTDERGTATYEYDVLDRLKARREADGAFVLYAYDIAGNISSIQTPGGLTSYTYDAKKRLTSVSDQQQNLTRYSYNDSGQLLSVEFPTGVTEVRSYAENGLLTSIVQSKGNNRISSFEYARDPDGRIESVRELDGTVRSFRYDATSRLASETISKDNQTTRTIEYFRNAAGDVVRLVDSVDGTTTYEYDDAGRLSRAIKSGVSEDFRYDANGNLVSRGMQGKDPTVYSWSPEGRLLEVVVPGIGGSTRIRYGYDYKGNRVSRTVNGVETKFLVDDNREHVQVLRDYTNSGTATDYTFGLNRISQSNVNQILYFIGDEHSGTRVLTDANGSTIEQFAYTAYGKTIAGDEERWTRFLYNGESRDSTTHLDDLRARSYDSTTGRFISRDQAGAAPGDLINLPRYQYAGGDPVNLRDPSGEFVPLIAAVLGIAGIAVVEGSAFAIALGVLEFAAGVLGGMLALKEAAYVASGAFKGGVHWKGPILRESAAAALGVEFGISELSAKIPASAKNRPKTRTTSHFLIGPTVGLSLKVGVGIDTADLRSPDVPQTSSPLKLNGLYFRGWAIGAAFLTSAGVGTMQHGQAHGFFYSKPGNPFEGTTMGLPDALNFGGGFDFATLGWSYYLGYEDYIQ